jgi:hypothetical protein
LYACRPTVFLSGFSRGLAGVASETNTEIELRRTKGFGGDDKDLSRACLLY